MTGRFPSLSTTGERRQARLADSRLVVVVGTRRDRGDLDELLTRVCDASADMLVLRDKTATEHDLRAASEVFRRVADRAGALFVVNDLPGLACQVGADGVLVGERDVHPDHARQVCGPDLLVGRTCHSLSHLDQAADEDVDYVEYGPIGQGDGAVAPLGTEGLAEVARRAATPWFVFGGLDRDVVAATLAAGARRVVLGRAVTTAVDPAAVCWQTRRALAAVHG